MNEIEIDLNDQETLELWTAVGELVERLPEQWVLIGGLMVQLHAQLRAGELLIQPKPSFLPFFEHQCHPQTREMAGVKHGSDGTRTRD